VTNANDGFNLEAAGKPGTGVFLVQPGETRSSSFTLVAQARA
jgi:aldose 1-epimerase